MSGSAGILVACIRRHAQATGPHRKIGIFGKGDVWLVDGKQVPRGMNDPIGAPGTPIRWCVASSRWEDVFRRSTPNCSWTLCPLAKWARSLAGSVVCKLIPRNSIMGILQRNHGSMGHGPAVAARCPVQSLFDNLVAFGSGSWRPCSTRS